MGWLLVKPDNKRVELRKGESILYHLQVSGVHIHAYCGGKGECGSCLVRVGRGLEYLSPITSLEEHFVREAGQRLACQARLLRDDVEVVVEVPRYARYKILERGRKKPVPPNPLVRVVEEASDRWVYWADRRLAPYEGELYGVALDIGTTTISMYWVDLNSGDEVFVASMQNPQVRFGDNIIDRVNFARLRGQKYLEKTIRDAVNELIGFGPIKPNHIYEMTVVGNSVMRDIFIGHSVESLGEAPFKPLSEEPVNVKAENLGIHINPEGNIYALPLIGHFVGADALAVVLATEIHKREEVSMAIDIGTNTEIIVGNKDKLVAASAASGPAFEGSGIKCGTGAVSGAIQKVEIDENLKVKYETVDQAAPVGVCGSGLIDALAQMLDRGILDWTGKFTHGENRFILAGEGKIVFIDEEDVDKLKLAKAAIAVGIKVTLRRYGVNPSEIDKIYLAGAFGTYINPVNAMKIGLLPQVSLERIERVGNAALEGARQALISKEKRLEAEAVPSKIEHVRLELEEDFQDLFAEELCFIQYG